jgi:8-amino-7-oxononanoate synthase
MKTIDSIYGDTTGTLLMKMKKSGERDVEKISAAMDALRQKQIKEGIFSFDCFTSQGSDTQSQMAIVPDGETRDCSIWSINHYLGLNRHPHVIERSIAAVREFGTGCGTSAISGGMSALHKQIELKLQSWFNAESVMLFPTGFTANMGLLAGICQAGDHVLIDDESHASIRDGIRLSSTRQWVSFEHNSMADLERKLIAAREAGGGKIVVVVESVYSMSGDICPMKELVALKDRHDFLLMVDEAHSFGLYGEHGKGLCQQEGVLDKVDFLTSTFSKATASIGGFVAMQSKYTSYLQWSANAFAFQACFSPADAGTILAAMEVLENDTSPIERLHANNRYMRGRLRAIGFDLGRSESPVIPIYIPNTTKLMKTCFELFKRGVFSVPIAYPMVREHEGRIRFIVNANHSRRQIDHTVDVLGQLAQEYGLTPSQTPTPTAAPPAERRAAVAEELADAGAALAC